PVVYAGSDREHMDLDVADVSPQPSTEQLDEGFTATVYPNVQENLKLAVKESVLLEEPASSSVTLSSLQHLSRDFSFGDQFFSDKHSDADKNAETKVESMSSKEHQQLKATTTDTTTTTTTTLPPPQAPQQSTTEAMMVKRIGELERIMADLIQVNKDMEERLDSHGSRLYTLEQLDIPQRVSIVVSEVVTDAVDWAMQAPLRNHFRDLPEADMKEILHQRMWESDSYKSHKDHMQLFEALEKSMNHDHSEDLAQDLAEARKKKKKSRESPKVKCHHHHLHLHPPIKKVHREHMDLDVADVSPQPSTEQLDEGFTATVYPNVQENLKLAVKESVLLEEPASSSVTLSSLQHLSRDFSFGDQFFSDKHSDADKNAETKVESMSSKEHQQLKATTTDTTTTTTTTLPPPQAPQQSTTEAMMVKRIGELERIMADLIQVNKDMEERLDSHGSRLYTLEQLDIPQRVSIVVSEVVTDAVDWAMQAPL
nr:hypothetical protein [Tanacetum cinerariifolium]